MGALKAEPPSELKLAITQHQNATSNVDADIASASSVQATISAWPKTACPWTTSAYYLVVRGPEEASGKPRRPPQTRAASRGSSQSNPGSDATSGASRQQYARSYHANPFHRMEVPLKVHGTPLLALRDRCRSTRAGRRRDTRHSLSQEAKGSVRTAVPASIPPLRCSIISCPSSG